MTQTHPITPPPELLAQPVAEGPSDEELDVIERQCWIPTEVCNDAGCEYLLYHRRFARAVLARWGHPTPQPVVEEPTIPNSTLHRQELTPLEITLLNAFWRSR